MTTTKMVHAASGCGQHLFTMPGTPRFAVVPDITQCTLPDGSPMNAGTGFALLCPKCSQTTWRITDFMPEGGWPT